MYFGNQFLIYYESGGYVICTSEERQRHSRHSLGPIEYNQRKLQTYKAGTVQTFIGLWSLKSVNSKCIFSYFYLKFLTFNDYMCFCRSTTTVCNNRNIHVADGNLMHILCCIWKMCIGKIIIIIIIVSYSFWRSHSVNLRWNLTWGIIICKFWIII